jgi:hypothetical protein
MQACMQAGRQAASVPEGPQKQSIRGPRSASSLMRLARALPLLGGASSTEPPHVMPPAEASASAQPPAHSMQRTRACLACTQRACVWQAADVTQHQCAHGVGDSED